VATAADDDAACISEQDLREHGPATNIYQWNDLPAEYTQDGCIDEGEWNSMVSGGPSGDQGLRQKNKGMLLAHACSKLCRSMLLPLCTHSSMYMHFAPPLP